MLKSFIKYNQKSYFFNAIICFIREYEHFQGMFTDGYKRRYL